MAPPSHVQLPPRVDVTVRDRTPLFQTLRKQIHPTPSVPLDVDALDASAKAPLTSESGAKAPPAYVGLFDEIRDIRQAIAVKLPELSRLHAQSLQSVFEKQKREVEQAVESTQSSIEALFRSAKSKISEFERQFPLSSLDPADQPVFQNLKIAAVSELTEISRVFRDEQRRYLAQRARTKAKAHQAAFGFDEEEAVLAALQKRDQYLDKGFTDEQIAQLEQAEAHINLRDKELSSIYDSLVGLNAMFVDLRDLVVDQGTMLDRIDFNISNTFETVQRANEVLRDAHETQKSSKIATVIMVLLLLIFVVAVLLMLKMAI